MPCSLKGDKGGLMGGGGGAFVPAWGPPPGNANWCRPRGHTFWALSHLAKCSSICLRRISAWPLSDELLCCPICSRYSLTS